MNIIIIWFLYSELFPNINENTTMLRESEKAYPLIFSDR